MWSVIRTPLMDRIVAAVVAFSLALVLTGCGAGSRKVSRVTRGSVVRNRACSTAELKRVTAATPRTVVTFNQAWDGFAKPSAAIHVRQHTLLVVRVQARRAKLLAVILSSLTFSGKGARLACWVRDQTRSRGADYEFVFLMTNAGHLELEYMRDEPGEVEPTTVTALDVLAG
jgi:hypothetical protein